MAYTYIPAFKKTNQLKNTDEFVIVVDGKEYLVTLKTLSDVFGNSPELLQQINAEIEALRNIVDALPEENPAAPKALKLTDTPTVDGIYKPTETGTYTNAGGLTYNPTEGITYFIRTSGVWTKDVTPINFTPTGVVEQANTNAVSGGKVYDFAKDVIEIPKGAIKNWRLGSYEIGSVVKHNNNIWIANTNILTAEPSVSTTAWRIYNPYSKSTALFISMASTLTIDLVTNEARFTGASTNKIVTDSGVRGITAQTVSLVNSSYFCFVYNSTTGIVSTVAVTDDNARALKSNEYIFGYVLKLTEPQATVYGINGYRLIKSTGTTEFPITSGGSSSSAPNVYNRNFIKYANSRTEVQKEWLNKALISVKAFNLNSNQNMHLYAIGKKYGSTNECYLSFIITETGQANKFIYASELQGRLNIPFDETLHTGIRIHKLSEGIITTNLRNEEVKAEIIIDWDAIPDGQRVLESNANVVNVNTTFLREKIVNSYIYGNTHGKVKFAQSRAFNEYYSAPTIESYSSATGISSMIPKAPYENVVNWLSKWDELITNKPLGYEITKEVLTTQVPTNTNESGNLPIYAYTFKPDKIRTGDSSTNSSQTLPKILIDCSIHGFEKTPSFVVYEFLKEMLFNWRSNSFLEYLRFNVEFVIIPSANPHGWNALNGAGTRKNYNQVDLNRNNKVGWVLNGNIDSPTYSGSSALSEIETQVLYNWMVRHNTGNVVLGIDFHNFHGTPQEDPKKYGLFWIINKSSELGQSCSNVLLKELSVKFKNKSNLIPQDDDYFVGSCNNTVGRGDAAVQHKELGATYGCTFEVAQNFRFDPDFKGFDSNAMTFGLEGFVNFLRVYLSNFIDEYNQKN